MVLDWFRLLLRSTEAKGRSFSRCYLGRNYQFNMQLINQIFQAIMSKRFLFYLPFFFGNDEQVSAGQLGQRDCEGNIWEYKSKSSNKFKEIRFLFRREIKNL